MNTLSKSQEGFTILERDGIKSRCPFVTAHHQFIQNNLGKTGLMSQFMSCSSLCPHWRQDDDILKISCSGIEVTLPIEKNEKTNGPAGMVLGSK